MITIYDLMENEWHKIGYIRDEKDFCTLYHCSRSSYYAAKAKLREKIEEQFNAYADKLIEKIRKGE